MKKINFITLFTILIACSFYSCSDGDCTQKTVYLDADKDGFGDPNSSKQICENDSLPEGYVDNADDADDSNAKILNVTIWKGTDVTFTKASNADWTLAANQDKITDKVILTRQNKRQIYNYQWWQDNFSRDAESEELRDDFWNDDNSNTNFTRTGGTKGLKWAILDDTGFDTSSSASDFKYYGTLGDPTNFYGFGGICSAIRKIDKGNSDITVGNFANGTDMSLLIGKKLGVWIEAEDIYFTLTFTEWGSGNSGGGSVAYKRSSKE